MIEIDYLAVAQAAEHKNRSEAAKKREASKRRLKELGQAIGKATKKVKANPKKK